MLYSVCYQSIYLSVCACVRARELNSYLCNWNVQLNHSLKSSENFQRVCERIETGLIHLYTNYIV